MQPICRTGEPSVGAKSSRCTSIRSIPGQSILMALARVIMDQQRSLAEVQDGIGIAKQAEGIFGADFIGSK